MTGMKAVVGAGPSRARPPAPIGASPRARDSALDVAHAQRDHLPVAADRRKLLSFQRSEPQHPVTLRAPVLSLGRCEELTPRGIHEVKEGVSHSHADYVPRRIDRPE